MVHPRPMKMETAKEEEDDNGGGIDETISGRDGLLRTLVLRLQVCRPALVLRKPLVKSYLRRWQNYLGITPAEYARGFRRPGLLTEEEHGRVHGDGGLPLRALDRRGLRYHMVLGHLSKMYRLRSGWGQFLRRTGLLEDDRHVGDVVELWAFRSPAWGTTLGLVLLHYTKEEEDQMTPMSHHRQVQSAITDQETEDDEATSSTSSLPDDSETTGQEELLAAITLVSMKRRRRS